ncbi:MAG: response regulator [Chloroflexi bacterium]|nr:response regulator [Chloroflexota bacterium]
MTNILLADDDGDLRAFLAEELRSAGYNVSAVKNGAEAIVAVAEGRYDLAILDMMMPGLDGVQAIRVLRKIAPGLQIIGITGYIGQGYMAQTNSLGVICLSKPVEVKTLLDEVAYSLTRKRLI